MIIKQSKNAERKRRHIRVRQKIHGTSERPRLNVFRSLNHIYAQVIDDSKSNTIVSASTQDSVVKDKVKSTGNKEAARMVGGLIAQRAIDRGIKSVVFDRGGYIYHGRVKELAEAARETGLEF